MFNTIWDKIMDGIGPCLLVVAGLFITALAIAIGISAIAGSLWVWQRLFG